TEDHAAQPLAEICDLMQRLEDAKGMEACTPSSLPTAARSDEVKSKLIAGALLPSCLKIYAVLSSRRPRFTVNWSVANSTCFTRCTSMLSGTTRRLAQRQPEPRGSGGIASAIAPKAKDPVACSFLSNGETFSNTS